MYTINGKRVNIYIKQTLSLPLNLVPSKLKPTKVQNLMNDPAIVDSKPIARMWKTYNSYQPLV